MHIFAVSSSALQLPFLLALAFESSINRLGNTGLFMPEIGGVKYFKRNQIYH